MNKVRGSALWDLEEHSRPWNSCSKGPNKEQDKRSRNNKKCSETESKGSGKMSPVE